MPIEPKKHEMPTQAPEVRAHNFKEVALGYDMKTAVDEAKRCLNCKTRPCVQGCPSSCMRKSMSSGIPVREQVYSWCKVRASRNRKT